MGTRPTLGRFLATPKSVQVGSKEYKIGPLRLKEIAELEEWAALQPFRLVQKKIKALGEVTLTEQERDRLLQKAESDSSNDYIKSHHMKSVEGVKQALLLSLRISHPDLKDEEFDEILGHHGLQFLEELLDEVTDLTEEETEK